MGIADSTHPTVLVRWQVGEKLSDHPSTGSGRTERGLKMIKKIPFMLALEACRPFSQQPTGDQHAGATGVRGEQRSMRRLVMLPSSAPRGSLG
jgi:hypothetical protein